MRSFADYEPIQEAMAFSYFITAELANKLFASDEDYRRAVAIFRDFT